MRARLRARLRSAVSGKVNAAFPDDFAQLFEPCSKILGSVGDFLDGFLYLLIMLLGE